MEILNRREQIGANSIPPEIPDVDTLVTKTDYATASKAGVVKIGNNITVSNGKISVPAASDETAGVVKIGENLSIDENGFLNASAGSSGITVDELWSGNISANNYTDITESLTHPLTDYKLLFCSYSGTNPSFTPIFVPMLQIGATSDNYMWFGLNNTENAFLRVTESTVKISSSGNKTGLKLYGIK